MLTLAAIALILPAALEAVAGTSQHLDRVSFSISVILLLVYSLYLAFALITHPALFTSSDVPENAKVQVSPARPGLLLAAAAAGIAWMSEIMVGAVEPAAQQLGLSDIFVGVFVVAVLGNAAEHTTAI